MAAAEMALGRIAPSSAATKSCFSVRGNHVSRSRTKGLCGSADHPEPSQRDQTALLPDRSYRQRHKAKLLLSYQEWRHIATLQTRSKFLAAATLISALFWIKP
jgi:hypothetical protein